MEESRCGFAYGYANVALDSTHQGLPTRVDTLETDVATRTTQHNNLQGEITNGQGAQNTRLDVLELQDTIQSSTNTTLTNLILALDARLDHLDGGASGAFRIETGTIGPLTTGHINTDHHAFATGGMAKYNTVHYITFPTGKFSAAPRVWVGQADPGNTTGHGSIVRVYVSAVTTAGATVVITDSDRLLFHI